MKSTPLLMLLLLYSNFIYSQEFITGKTIDPETNSPVPYVNIGIRKSATGTVSDEFGNYKLKISNLNDTVTFTSIGYQTVNIPATTLVKNGKVGLTVKSYDLQTIEVTPAMLAEDELILGKKLDKKGHSIGFGSSQLGTEIGALIKVNKKTLIKSAHFILNHAKGDSLLFRVNLFAAEGGRIGENLLKENVLIASRQEKGAITVDLSPYNLVVDDDVLLSLQWIRDDNGRGNTGVTFRGKGAANSNLYYKLSSVGDFQKVSDTFSGAPNLQLSFYLTGKLLK